ncbi:MAG: hypothetical protein JJ926_17680 [Roseitalea sp.]|nr:hypothetical protein [Roseitalea sp.]MBO6953710.1 hypothetical protein [Rhizobiaceae bacterium]MBO6594059.1 hypothetical protein [Roseitalea sp.]MBO6601508.1 hypothetical protein [Roseitalea sp.]MBO6613598.1 hypothetical protein [Roseitalea sp.]
MAQRARPSRGAGRGGTRKPVTIDLEAEKTAGATAGGASKSSAEKAAKPKAAEPVAMEQAAKPGARASTAGDKASATGNEASPFAKAGEDGKAEKAQPGGTDRSGDADTPRTHRAAPPTPPAPARRGGSGAIAGGIIGGVIALVAGAGLQWTGLLPSFGSAPAETVDLAPVQSEIAQLQARLDEMAAAPASGEAAVPAELAGQIEAAAQAARSAQADSGSALSAIETLTADIDALRSAMSSGAAGEGAGLETLSGRLDQIEAQVTGMTAQMADLSASGADAAGAEAMQALGETVAAVQGDLDALRGDLDTLAGDVGTVRDSVQGMETTVSDGLAALAARIDANEAALSEAQDRLAEGGADSTVVARAIAAAGLKSAIDRGSAFATELEAYASVAGEDETVAQLRDFAASGVPTVTQLSDGFAAVANRIVATGQGLDENASLGDRLMSSARSLVQVRPVGEAEGDTPGAIAARVETRLKDGNLEGALAEWETLPDPAKAASADFMDRVRARQTVDQLVAGALATAMSAARPSAPPAGATQ